MSDKTTHSPLPHLPLPWLNNGGRIEDLEGNYVANVGVVHEQSYIDTGNARLIIASVNHAEKLAEELRRLANSVADNCVDIHDMVSATSALAAWEKGHQ